MTARKYDHLLNEWIELYTVKGLSSGQLSKKYDVTDTTVLRYLTGAGINTSKVPAIHEISEWIEMYTIHGLSCEKIAELYPVSSSTVWKNLKASGIDTSHKRTVVTQQMASEWVDLYIKNGLTLGGIAELYPVSDHTIWKYLNIAGIDTSMGYVTDEMAEIWADLYTRGVNTVQIGEMYSASPSTVRKHLTDSGIDTSSFTYDYGRIYIVFRANVPIYVGQTQFSIEHRLSTHIRNSSRRIGDFARYIDDNKLTVADLYIYCLEDNIPTSCLSEVERSYIKKWWNDVDYKLLNNAHSVD